MAKEFRRPKPGENPTEGNVEELLADPPEGREPGSLEAYAGGTKVRRWIFGLLIFGTIGAGIAGHRYVKYLEEERKKITPVYVVDEETAANAVREFYWDDGTARLGLSRQPPGVNLIVLPDWEIRLADDYDHAQINVTVREGTTIKLKVLAGKINRTPREVEGSTPAPEAKAL